MVKMIHKEVHCKDCPIHEEETSILAEILFLLELLALLFVAGPLRVLYQIYEWLTKSKRKMKK